MTDLSPLPTAGDPIGVSAVVRLRTQIREHPPGTYALVIDQAPHGRRRYRVMVPGDPLPFYPLADELEVVQGVAPQCWWKRTRSPAATDLWALRAAATGGGPCDRCGEPFYTHVCLSCSPDAQTPGPGCVNCRNTGMDQTPCLPAAGPQ